MSSRVKVLQWDKVSLVLPEKGDAELRYQWMNNLEISQYLSNWASLLFKENEEEHYDKIRKDPNIRYFSICVNDGDKIIWFVCLEIKPFHRNAEIGIVIYNPEYHWKGYWTESMKLALKYWFEIMWLHKMFLYYLKNNERAGKVYEKCWFRVIGVRKEHWYYRWKYLDFVEVEMLEDEYRKLYC